MRKRKLWICIYYVCSEKLDKRPEVKFILACNELIWLEVKINLFKQPMLWYDECDMMFMLSCLSVPHFIALCKQSLMLLCLRYTHLFVISGEYLERSSYTWLAEVPVFKRIVFLEQLHQSRHIHVIVIVKVAKPSTNKQITHKSIAIVSNCPTFYRFPGKCRTRRSSCNITLFCKQKLN